MRDLPPNLTPEQQEQVDALLRRADEVIRELGQRDCQLPTRAVYERISEVQQIVRTINEIAGLEPLSEAEMLHMPDEAPREPREPTAVEKELLALTERMLAKHGTAALDVERLYQARAELERKIAAREKGMES